MEQFLISAPELAARRADPAIRIFDASFHMTATGRDADAEFLQAHIPQARRFDIDHIADHATTLPHMLPSAAVFAEAMSAAGVHNSDTVVVYDSVGFFSVARAWWMMRVFGHESVFILDGGLPAWQAAGFPVVGGEPEPVPPSTYHAKQNDALVVDKPGIARVRDAGGQIVDARSAARFSGAAPDPRPGVRPGHIPGSINIPLATLHAADGTVLPPDRLRTIFAEAGISIEAPVVATCGSGVTACGIAFSLALLGANQVAVYDGSWSDWGADQSLPAERTPSA